MIPQRKSIRLPDYNYSSEGYYFVTICTQNKECLFGETVNGEMVINNVGKMVNDWWIKIPERFPNTNLDTFQIMPNHLHGIIIINSVGARSSRPSRPNLGGKNVSPLGPENPAPTTLGQIIANFKYLSTKEVNAFLNRGYQKLWQRNYYEHVIRNDEDLSRIREYILNNPLQWDLDEENPKNIDKTN